MSKPELGTKRLCAGCNAKFYDLHKTPIVCPTCETVFVPPKPLPTRSRRPVEAMIAPLPVAAAAVASVAETDAGPTAAEKPEGDAEPDAGVPLLEELDED